MFERLRAANPHPTTELEYASAFELLIAVILSAQATDRGVNIATRKLFPIANTPKALLELGEEGLLPYIRTIGLYKNKGKNKKTNQTSKKALKKIHRIQSKKMIQKAEITTIRIPIKTDNQAKVNFLKKR